MAGAELTGADLRGARFRGAILTGAKLAGAMIDPQALATCVVDPTQRALDRAGLLIERLQVCLWAASDGVEGGAAELDGEDLRPLGEAFVGRRLPAISARRSCGVDMNFVGAQLQGARFDDADLRGADFSRADLRGACFRGANLRFARFGDADIRALPLASGGACPVDLDGGGFRGAVLRRQRARLMAANSALSPPAHRILAATALVAIAVAAAVVSAWLLAHAPRGLSLAGLGQWHLARRCRGAWAVSRGLEASVDEVLAAAAGARSATV